MQAFDRIRQKCNQIVMKPRFHVLSMTQNRLPTSSIAIVANTSFHFHAADWYTDGATSTIRVQLPDAPQFQKSEVILMTATRVAQQLIHAALDVVAPLERFSYLSGVLDGYKLAREEVEGQQFRVQNKDDVQEHSRA